MIMLVAIRCQVGISVRKQLVPVTVPKVREVALEIEERAPKHRRQIKGID